MLYLICFKWFFTLITFKWFNACIWILLCTAKWLLTENVFSHISHGNGFSLLYVQLTHYVSCFFLADFLQNQDPTQQVWRIAIPNSMVSLSVITHRKCLFTSITFERSLVTVRTFRWILKLCLLENSLLQYSHDVYIDSCSWLWK